METIITLSDLPRELIEVIANYGDLEYFLRLRSSSKLLVKVFQKIRFYQPVRYDQVRKIAALPKFDYVVLRKPVKRYNKLVRMKPSVLKIDFRQYYVKIVKIPKSITNLSARNCILYLDPLRNKGLKYLGIHNVGLRGMVTDNLVYLSLDSALYPLEKFRGFGKVEYFSIDLISHITWERNEKYIEIYYNRFLYMLRRMPKLIGLDIIFSECDTRFPPAGQILPNKIILPHIPLLKNLCIIARYPLLEIYLGNITGLDRLSIETNNGLVIHNPPEIGEYVLQFIGTSDKSFYHNSLNIPAKDVTVVSDVDIVYMTSSLTESMLLIGRALCLITPNIKKLGIKSNDFIMLRDPRDIVDLYISAKEITLNSLGNVKNLNLEASQTIVFRSSEPVEDTDVARELAEKQHMNTDLLESVNLSATEIRANIFGRLKNVKRTYKDNKLVYLEYTKTTPYSS